MVKKRRCIAYVLIISMAFFYAFTVNAMAYSDEHEKDIGGAGVNISTVSEKMGNNGTDQPIKPIYSHALRISAQYQVTFHFDYGDKSDVISTYNEDDKIGNDFPRQDIINVKNVKIGQYSYNLKLRQIGFVSNGRFISMADMPNEVINKDATYNAYYNVVAEYNLVAFDGRDTKYHMSESDVAKKLQGEFGVKDKSGNIYKTKWTNVSAEEQKSSVGPIAAVSRFEYKGQTEFPLKDIDGNFIKYDWYNDSKAMAKPFESVSSNANQYGGEMLYKTPHYQWFWIYVSDASEKNHVRVNVKLNRTYSSRQSKKAIDDYKTYSVDIGSDEYEPIDIADKGSNTVSVGGNINLFERDMKNFTSTYYSKDGDYTHIKSFQGYGGVTINAEPEEMKGYTLMKSGEGIYKNDGKPDAFVFRYYKNLTLKFNAAFGGTTIKSNGKDMETVPALQKIKVDINKIPGVNDVKDETFLGWADKEDKDKNIIDFNNYVPEKDTEFIPIFRVHDAKRITPVDPEKTKVIDPSHLTDKEKNEVIEKVEKANKGNFPTGTNISVNDDGSVIVKYPDNSIDTIPSYKTVEKITTADNSKPNNLEKQSSSSNAPEKQSLNPNTGDKVMSGFFIIILLSCCALYVIKIKQKDK